MKIVLDASLSLSWLMMRPERTEAMLADRAFDKVSAYGAEVPAFWYAEVGNTLLVLERAKKLTEQDAARYLSDLALLQIVQDEAPGAERQGRVLDLSRRYELSAYQATYLELAMRRSGVLATFDKKLADAARRAGVRVFGDLG
ncbi:MAG TPA: type II toxin-antitoxin system VapC family toxin [Terracidiphilus sp.]|nr:type II toxin-antitoxin system VapC family toxin [Terracidiphilus sp.]